MVFKRFRRPQMVRVQAQMPMEFAAVPMQKFTVPIQTGPAPTGREAAGFKKRIEAIQKEQLKRTRQENIARAREIKRQRQIEAQIRTQRIPLQFAPPPTGREAAAFKKRITAIERAQVKAQRQENIGKARAKKNSFIPRPSSWVGPVGFDIATNVLYLVTHNTEQYFKADLDTFNRIIAGNEVCITDDPTGQNRWYIGKTPSTGATLHHDDKVSKMLEEDEIL